MNNNSFSFYKESGIAPVSNLILIVSINLVITLFLSYFYSLIINFMPIVYFNILLVLLYGYSIALISQQLNKVFKIRNQKKAIATTVITAIFAVYFQWVSYFYVLSTSNIDFTHFFEIFFSPIIVIKDIIQLNSIGLWGMFGITINKLPLAIIWLAECALIVFTAYIGHKKMRVEPFSEATNKWYKKYYIDKDFEPIYLKNDFLKELKNNPLQAISSLKLGFGSRYARFYIYSLKSEPKSLIAIDNVLVTQGDNGSKKEITTILEPCYINSNDLNQIKEQFKLKKPTLLDYINDIYQQ